MENRAIILAAGRGSRMGKETELKPKCLSKLDNKHLLEWQLESIKKNGINDITVVRGYKSHMLTGDFKTIDNKRWSETNMVASLFCVEKSSKNTIISYSDIVYKSDHIKKLSQSKHDITITADLLWEDLWKLRLENPLDDAETFKSKNNLLLEIGKKTDNISNIEAQYMGLIQFSPKGWDTMYNLYQTFSDKKKDKMDMTSMLNELLSRDIKINVVFIEGGWCEADTYSDILAYREQLENTKNWKHDWR